MELDNPVPYFVSLTVYPTLYPLNEKFVTEQGAKFGLESNTTLYNSFVLMNGSMNKVSSLRRIQRIGKIKK